MSANPVQREKRRRRVLRDEATEVRKNERPETKSGRRYADAALEDAQFRITDFLPRSAWKLAAVLTAGLTVVSCLEIVYRWQTQVSAENSLAISPSFDLASVGSLGTWFATMAMLGCSLVSLVIYNIRRHRIADYRGRYRLWSWAAIVFLIASVSATTRIDQVAASLAYRVTGGHVLSSVPAWLLVGWSVIGLTVAVPMLLELRMSQTTIAGLLASGICYSAAGLLHVGTFQGSTVVQHVAMQSGLLYVGHVLMFTSLLAFARLVFLDAQGELIRRPRAVKPVVAPEWAVAFRMRQKERRVARRNGQPSPRKKPAKPGKAVAGKVKPQPAKDETAAEQEMDPTVLENLDLTKTERRKLRKQMRQQQRRAA